MTQIDGVFHYDLADVQAGLCEPGLLWKPNPGVFTLPPLLSKRLLVALNAS
jgi:hypothetical protein